ncbi:MAG: NAD(P)H-dependent flavin oxidoreductase, partial [Flavobacteriales bacterium]
AGNPKKFTSTLQKEGIKVVHVVSSVKFALKAQEAGVDAVVAEGFEAGGHNGKEETTTLVLTPAVADAIDIPLVSAGGIKDGRSMLACIALGADGVQMGSRFVMSKESSAHEHFKLAIQNATEGSTHLTLKELTPVRLLKNPFYQQIQDAYSKGSSNHELKQLLGKGRAKKGMFLGDMVNGELEIGQAAAYMDDILSADSIIQNTLKEYKLALSRIQNLLN